MRIATRKFNKKCHHMLRYDHFKWVIQKLYGMVSDWWSHGDLCNDLVNWVVTWLCFNFSNILNYTLHLLQNWPISLNYFTNYYLMQCSHQHEIFCHTVCLVSPAIFWQSGQHSYLNTLLHDVILSTLSVRSLLKADNSPARSGRDGFCRWGGG